MKTSSQRKRVVILGGGFAGLAAARGLRGSRLDVTLVDRRAAFEFLPNIHELLSGVKTPQLLRIPLARATRRLGHRFVRDEVVALDADAGCVTTAKGRTLDYDALVFALGGVNATHGVAGVDENALAFKSVADCARIGRELARLARRGEPGRVVIVGGGLEGIEALGEILRAHRGGGGLTITLVEARERLLPEGPPAVNDHLLRLCAEWPVEVLTRSPVARVEAGHVVLSDGRDLPSDCTIWTGGPAPPPLLAQSGLASAREWVGVRSTLQHPSHPELFVVGDACALPKPAAKQAYHALDMGTHAAHNVRRHLDGRPPRVFQPAEKPMLVSFGDLSCFVVAGPRVFAGPALSAGKEAIFEWVMHGLDDEPWWGRLAHVAGRLDRAARRLLWPSVSSLEAILRQHQFTDLTSG